MVTVVATLNGCVSDPVIFEITIDDSEDPVFTTCPGPIVVGSDVDECGAYVNFTLPTAIDNCGIQIGVASCHWLISLNFQDQ